MFLNTSPLEQVAKSFTPKSIPIDKSSFKAVWFSYTSTLKVKTQHLPL